MPTLFFLINLIFARGKEGENVSNLWGFIYFQSVLTILSRNKSYVIELLLHIFIDTFYRS